jgi:hypothetical protein
VDHDRPNFGVFGMHGLLDALGGMVNSIKR